MSLCTSGSVLPRNSRMGLLMSGVLYGVVDKVVFGALVEEGCFAGACQHGTRTR